MAYNEKSEEWKKINPETNDEFESSHGGGSGGSSNGNIRKRNGSVLSSVGSSNTAYTNFSAFPSNETSATSTSSSSWGPSLGSPVERVNGIRFKTDAQTATALGLMNPASSLPTGVNQSSSATSGTNISLNDKRGRLSRQSSLTGMKGGSSGGTHNLNTGMQSFTSDQLMAYPIVGSGGEEEMLKLGLGYQKELRAGGERLVEIDLNVESGPVRVPSRPPSGGGGRIRNGSSNNLVGMQITPPEDEKGRRSISSNRSRSDSMNGNGIKSGNNSGRNSRDLEPRRSGVNPDRKSKEMEGKGDGMEVDETNKDSNEKKSEEDKIKGVPRFKIDKDTFVDGLVSK
jgi:hypothetical protein